MEAVQEQADQGTAEGPVGVQRTECMKLCPEDGITVCALRPRQFQRPEPIAVHSAEEVEVFFGVEITETLVPGRR